MQERSTLELKCLHGVTTPHPVEPAQKDKLPAQYSLLACTKSRGKFARALIQPYLQPINPKLKIMLLLTILNFINQQC